MGQSKSALGYEAFRWKDPNCNGLVDPNENLDNHPEFGLGDLPGGIFDSYAVGVSTNGLSIVGYGNSTSGVEAFHWTSSDGMVGLGDLSGGSFGSLAYGVSADGSIVVGMGTSASGYEAFRWKDPNCNGLVDPNENLENHPEFGLGDLPGGGFISKAYGVSADGSTVVGMGTSVSGTEAFRWTSSGGMVGLGDLSGGGFFSEAYDVSADGSVVVGEGTSAASGNEAFIWDNINGMRSLKDVLVNNFGLDLTGWKLEGARGISDDGVTIVGYGENPSGNTEAWIATLCEYHLAGDNNNDCKVNFFDLAIMAGNWLTNCNATPGDPECIPK